MTFVNQTLDYRQTLCYVNKECINIGSVDFNAESQNISHKKSRNEKMKKSRMHTV